MLRKLKWQIPGEPLAARYYWCQGPVPGRGPAVEKHCSRLQLGWNLVRTWTRKQAIKTRVLTFFLTPTSFIRSKSFPILHASCYHRHHYHISKPQILTASCNKQHKIRTRDSLFELIRYSTSDRLPYLLWPREPGYHSSARTLHVVTQIVSHIHSKRNRQYLHIHSNYWSGKMLQEAEFRYTTSWHRSSQTIAIFVKLLYWGKRKVYCWLAKQPSNRPTKTTN